MQRPIDDPQQGKKVHKAHLRGDYALEEVGFWYDDEEKLTVLNISKLQIRAGERVAVLGRNGSGKARCCSCWQGCGASAGQHSAG